MGYFGKGIYTLSVAAKILKMKPQTMRRWINGYTYYKNMECRSSTPLFETEFKYDSNDVIISFLDLTELLFIKTYIGYGISIQKIRNAAITASKLMNTSHPFAQRRIFTDGKTIFAKIAEETNDTYLLDLLTKQYHFEKIMESFLYGSMDFNRLNYVKRWWPLGKKGAIVLDPARNMGQPILNKYNIKTELIYELYKTNHSINEINEWYELDLNSIETAIDYEKKLIA